MASILTSHARSELLRRGLDEAVVRAVADGPEQRWQVRPGRDVCQSRVSFGAPGRVYLVRVFVDVDREPNEIVTAYRTSRTARYWRTEL